MIQTERQQELARLQRNINPFGEVHGPDDRPKPGLNQFFLQMSDPSIATIQGVASSLVTIPYEDLWTLRRSTYNSSPGVELSLSGRPMNVQDAERIQEGRRNADKLLDKVLHSFDYSTHLPMHYEGSRSTPDDIAQDVHFDIQISKGDRDLDKATEAVQQEPDLKKRNRLALRLKKQAMDYIKRFNITLYKRSESYNDNDEEEDSPPETPTWKQLIANSDWDEESARGVIVGGTALHKAVEASHASTRRYALEKRFEKVPPLDRERYNELRLKYGAKGAGLIILSELTKTINKLGDHEMAVPEFKTVDTDMYTAWKDGQPVDDQLKSYYDWANSLKDDTKWYTDDKEPADYIVRSSAVFSEDGEEMTGAGIYSSEVVRAGANFDEFKAAVERVYASTDNPQAQSYRSQHGVPDEKMGLVIQKYVTTSSMTSGNVGYVNTKLPGVPQLMEICSESSRNFIKRNPLDFMLAMPSSYIEDVSNIHHFKPDKDKTDPYKLIKIARLLATIEKVWGRDIQAEFVVDGATINIVQVRDLPAALFQNAETITFPDEPYVHGGSSIGTGNMELKILPSKGFNNEKTGAVVYHSSHMWSFDGNPDYLPKKGAVILTGDDEENGHIQTLCAEKGLICIFPDRNDYDKPTLWVDELEAMKRIKVVSNGIEGRVYPGKEPQENKK